MSMRNLLAEYYSGGQWVPQHINLLVDVLIFKCFTLNSKPYRDDPSFADEVQNASNCERLMEFMADMMCIKVANDNKKKHVVKTRQGVRAMVLGLPKKG
jgi:hypothetical protein